MNLPVEALTPQQIVEELDLYIVGQSDAKRAVAVALRNRFRRLQLPLEQRADILPKNILMMGPTGVGKTEIARRLAQLSKAPFIKVEATKFTEVGYVGRDVESIIRDLAANAVRLVEQERMVAAWPQAEELAYDRIADDIAQQAEISLPRNVAVIQEFDEDDASTWSDPSEDYAAIHNARLELKSRILEELKAGQHQEKLVDVEFEESGSSFLQAFTPQGMEEINLDMFGGNSPFSNSRRSSRRLPVSEAFHHIVEHEAKLLMDSGSVTREAIQRAEETGIVFIDEIDKVAIKSQGSGPDVSREGVQRDLLPIVEGSTVATKYGPVRTDHILFIAAGAFHMAKPSDLIPELQGRLPIRVELESLTEEDFKRILKEPRNALSKQYQQLLGVDQVTLVFTDDAIEEVAGFAREVNNRTENIGARRLHTIMERLLQDVLFEAPYPEQRTLVYDGPKVAAKLRPLIESIQTAEKVL